MLRLTFCNTVATDVLRLLEQYGLFHNVFGIFFGIFLEFFGFFLDFFFGIFFWDFFFPNCLTVPVDVSRLLEQVFWNSMDMDCSRLNSLTAPLDVFRLHASLSTLQDASHGRMRRSTSPC